MFLNMAISFIFQIHVVNPSKQRITLPVSLQENQGLLVRMVPDTISGDSVNLNVGDFLEADFFIHFRYRHIDYGDKTYIRATTKTDSSSRLLACSMSYTLYVEEVICFQDNGTNWMICGKSWKCPLPSDKNFRATDITGVSMNISHVFFAGLCSGPCRCA